jgi:hypothetical protein
MSGTLIPSTDHDLPTVESLRAYLGRTGWAMRDDDDRTQLWVPTGENAPDVQVVLPSRESRDAGVLIAEALPAVAFGVRRTVDEVLIELTEPLDLVAVRLRPDAPSGQAPIGLVDSAIRGLEKLLVGTASSLINPALVLPTRRPAAAERYVRSVRIAASPGSFILTLMLPLDHDSGQLQLVQQPLEVPFGRRTSSRLTDFADEALTVSGPASGDDTAGYWNRAGAEAPNATVLDGLATIGGEAHLPYDLRIVQSHTVPGARPTAARYTVGEEQQVALAEAARYLRSHQPSPGTVVQGLVVTLRRTPVGGPGEAVVEGTYDDSGAVGRVTLHLDEPDYDEAIRAHTDGLHVVATGDLVTHGTRRVLEPIRSFAVVESP